ncbi:MAG TPA: DNA gyrase inhibitor YacG [Pyrinomonadaceae bacterium]|nr:DNA gyrase inhibitor YacG [Pyrinomonadaceae bacterium]
MKCPTCNKEVDWQENQFRPFCSERCKLVDLGKWVNEEYRVPGRPVPTEEENQETEPED